MNRDLFDFFVKSEKPLEFVVTSFSTWWGCLYETFLYILNHLLLLWQCLLDTIRFISSSKEHCSVKIAETAALCNFVIALIYSESCFSSPAVKYKEEKNNQYKSTFYLTILMCALCSEKRRNEQMGLFFEGISLNCCIWISVCGLRYLHPSVDKSRWSAEELLSHYRTSHFASRAAFCTVLLKMFWSFLIRIVKI